MTLHQNLSSWDNLTTAYQDASRGKRGKPATAGFELYLADELLKLEHELETQTYQPGSYHSFYIHEPKRRLISAAPFRDRVVHHALCLQTVPYFEKRMIPNSYANRVGKGTHRALDRCQEFARRFRYCLPCDVRQFFPSIDHEILKAILTRMLPDSSLDWLIERILQSGQGVLAEEYQMVHFPGDDLLARFRPRGLPIGNLTSQWWANCYLTPFDQFIQRELRCSGYQRYVDDILLFSDDKSELLEWRAALIERMARFRLTIHEESSRPRPVGEGIPYLGFIVFPDKRRLKSRRGFAYRRKLRRMVQSGDVVRLKASVQGWINHARYGNTAELRKSVLADCGLLAWEVLDAR